MFSLVTIDGFFAAGVVTEPPYFFGFATTPTSFDSAQPILLEYQLIELSENDKIYCCSIFRTTREEGTGGYGRCYRAVWLL
mmetsp:Transcript_46506/g.53779  ORF Transcript_46506/g.53779 Transcript_46506/m.53779 type:complete len:81 (-) Transcript_46506:159-401(-)